MEILQGFSCVAGAGELCCIDESVLPKCF
jgi:hypothetical protein